MSASNYLCAQGRPMIHGLGHGELLLRELQRAVVLSHDLCAMGLLACEAACRFILEQTSTRTVVDPFCGHGTVLAVANDLGLDAIGVEKGRKRAEKAQALVVTDGALL